MIYHQWIGLQSKRFSSDFHDRRSWHDLIEYLNEVFWGYHPWKKLLYWFQANSIKILPVVWEAFYRFDHDTLQKTFKICVNLIEPAFLFQENNFKAVLESIRDLMNEETIIPDWLTNIFLGYGDPAGAQYQNIVKEDPEAFISTVDFKDTFLDKDHLIQSFPGKSNCICQRQISSKPCTLPQYEEAKFIYRRYTPRLIYLAIKIALQGLSSCGKFSFNWN